MNVITVILLLIASLFVASVHSEGLEWVHKGEVDHSLGTYICRRWDSYYHRYCIGVLYRTYCKAVCMHKTFDYHKNWDTLFYNGTGVLFNARTITDKSHASIAVSTLASIIVPTLALGLA